MCRLLVKFGLFFVNLIFMIIGVLVIAGGVFVIYQLRSFSELLPELPAEAVEAAEDFAAELNFVPYIIIALGSIIFLISFCGCCGTITETKCLLITYASFVGLITAAKIVITILLFVKLAFLTETAENAVNNMFASEDAYQNATFHVIEMQLKCCGTTGPEAYVNEYNLTSPTCCAVASNVTLPIGDLPIENLPIDQIPAGINLTKENQQRENLPSLPANLPGNISIGDIDLGGLDLGNLTLCTREDSYQTGCTTLIANAVNTIGKAFGIGLVIVIVFELFVMIFTIYLIKTMKSRLPKKYVEQPRYYY